MVNGLVAQLPIEIHETVVVARTAMPIRGPEIQLLSLPNLVDVTMKMTGDQ